MENKEKIIKWFKCARVRVIKTFAQIIIATIETNMAMGDIKWVLVGNINLLAEILSLLTSIAGFPELKNQDNG